MKRKSCILAGIEEKKMALPVDYKRMRIGMIGATKRKGRALFFKTMIEGKMKTLNTVMKKRGVEKIDGTVKIEGDRS